MKYAYVKSSAKSIDVLDAKTLNKISTLQTNRSKCVLDVDDGTIFVGCWESSLEIFSYKGNNNSYLNTPTNGVPTNVTTSPKLMATRSSKSPI